ncbi:MAG: phosphoribosylamine--glycine ligase [Actinobacteria bacterium]|nr:phosphoribosylamine--glycine ligase [Actinomycetota bacterium]MBE0448662.1 phosphoribosylamine--glycine ligase [Actinomycetota bacterium]
MRVLVIGGGGREHALAWKINQSPMVGGVFCIPGNGGIAEIAQCLRIDQSNSNALADFAVEKSIGLTVIGPEAPLVAGVADAFAKRGLKVFGPNRKAAQLEGSKIFAKYIMNKYGIPTARAELFADYNEAASYLESVDAPYVVKADGLAAGKGVFIAKSLEEAKDAIRGCLVEGKFGSAGQRVIIEEYLDGPELSVLAFSDGKNVLPMVPAQDYKRAYDNDAGLNTGGMGSYSPVPIVDPALYDEIVEMVLRPTINGLASEGIEYRGIIYAGLMLTKSGPKVLEFNARFGDPETQAILPRLESDILEPMLAVADGDLSGVELKWKSDVCTTVVLASGGYPGDYATGFEIAGLEEAASIDGVTIFHAGTRGSNGKIVTSGGRVLNVSALGEDFSQARERAYAVIGKVHFENMHFRKDIALRAASR